MKATTNDKMNFEKIRANFGDDWLTEWSGIRYYVRRPRYSMNRLVELGLMEKRVSDTFQSEYRIKPE